MMSKEEYKEAMEKQIINIKKDKDKFHKNQAQEFSSKSKEKHIKNIKSMLLFLVFFLLGDIIIVLMQMTINERFQETDVKTYISTKEFKFDPFFYVTQKPIKQ